MIETETQLSLAGEADIAIRQLIAMAIGAVLEVGTTAFPAEWDDEKDNPRDIQIGTTNDWWLRKSRDDSLYIQSRYIMRDWIKGRDSEVRALRLRKLLSDIQYHLGVWVSLPVGFDERMKEMQG